MKNKIIRNMSTPESGKFWEEAERNAVEIQRWPAWKRAGINVAQLRQEPRLPPNITISINEHELKE